MLRSKVLVIRITKEVNMSECIFCKIINNEIPSVKIYEDESFIAILDKFPTAKAHILVMPKKHEENIFEASEETTKNIFPVVQKIAIALKKMGYGEINILQNNGEIAGQTVMHLHIHLIPREENDNVKILFDSKMCEDFVLEEIKNKINKYL